MDCAVFPVCGNMGSGMVTLMTPPSLLRKNRANELGCAAAMRKARNLLFVLVVAEAVATSLAAEHRGAGFLAWTAFDSWHWSESGTERVCESPVIDCPFAWRELVMSWNASAPSGTGFKFEVRAYVGERQTRYYVMGFWTEAPGDFPRNSVNGQQDADGEVRTDTLSLREACRRVQLRVTFYRSAGVGWPRLRFLGIAFSDPTVRLPPLRPNTAAWGRTLDVPCRSQVDYPEGVSAWCSPTCVSMVLAYWARAIRRPELDKDVPTVARGVHDPSWEGTGNWSFNTAYAGQFDRLRAYVTRLSDVSEIEAWIARGAPVVTSVCYDLLRGRARTRNSGHLIVCVGFTDKGDVVVNDPGTRQEMRRSFPRDDFMKAWDYSNRTVYLIYPVNFRPPADRFGHWSGKH